MVAHVGYVHGGVVPGGSATVAFDHGGGQVDSAAQVEWDLDNDGNFDDAHENVTTDVISADARTGRDFPSQLSGRAGPGQLRLQLRNDDDKYSYFNADSPLNQDGRSLKVGRKIRLRVAAEHALASPGGAGVVASTPDDPVLDITGDQVLACEFQADSLGVIQTLLSKWDTGTPQRSIMLQINASGQPRLLHSPDGTLAAQVINTCPVALTSLKRQALWAWLDVDNGAAGHTVHFYWGHRLSEGPVGEMGTATTGGVTSVFSGSAPLRACGWGTVPTEPFVGHVYEAALVAGTILSTDVRADADITDLPPGTTSFTDLAGRPWTVAAPGAVVDNPVEHLDEPTLLARDRFNRGNTKTLGYLETGQPWLFSHAGEGYRVVAKQAQGTQESNAVPMTARRIAYINTGQVEHYVQATFERCSNVGTNRVGIIAGRIDGNNYVFMEAAEDGISVGHVVAGVSTELAFSGFFPLWAGLVMGLRVTPTGSCYGYINGMEFFLPDSPGVPFTTTLRGGTGAGLVYRWDTSSFDVEAPRIDNFHVWDRKVRPVPGVLWTGQVTEVKPSVTAGPTKSAQLTAEGSLATAAAADVVNPRSLRWSRFPGLVGSTLHAADLLHPGGIIEVGGFQGFGGELESPLAGPNVGDDGNALELCRRFEEAELGFLYEMPEGPPGFQARDHRADTTAVAEWSDDVGAQFVYETLDPLDQRRDVINRVTAGIAPDQPEVVSVTQDSNVTAGGVANNVTVGPLPSVDPGDLLVIFIASSVGATSVNWINPIWWGNHRPDLRGDIRCRVYSHHCDGTEDGDSVTFYIDSSNSGGAWEAQIFRIRNWYKASAGVTERIEFVNGANPGALTHGWGKVPTLFIAVNAALTSASGGGFVAGTSLKYPNGYENLLAATIRLGVVPGHDVGLATAHRLALAEGEDPDSFVVFTDFAINESAVMAIRGFDGEHLLLPTLKNPSQFQASPGRFVTIDDHAAQDEQRTVRSNPSPANLFWQESDATEYATLLMNRFRDDRPIFTLGFTANKGAAYRRQAYTRRVGDRIHLVAANSSGMGVEADFFIEAIGHTFDHGTKLWQVTWELSPA